MLRDDEDIFESVAWETPRKVQNVTSQDADNGLQPSRPGYRETTGDSIEHDPHEPKWEGYLITSVKDPVKELPETKDAYVSYLVSAKVW